jgi:hypothetical protein
MQRFLAMLLLLTGMASAQESLLGADFRHERERFTKNCSSFKSLAGCAQVLFTDHPLHIAVGSIAPQNGFAAGVAFVAHKTPNESWRLSWNSDAVASFNGSWRAGVYMKIVRTPKKVITVGHPTGPGSLDSNLAVSEYKVFNVYAQGISLNKLYYFGLGPTSSESARSVYGMTESIVGGNTVIPVFQKLKMSLVGELNGRFISIRGNHGESSPSIEQAFDNVTAPGLANQPGYIQFGEGIRIRPSFLSDHVRLNYLVNFQQFLAPSDSSSSFGRFTGDFAHEFPLYRTTRPSTPKEFNGPNECSMSVGAACPPISASRNREGTINLRVLLSKSMIATGHTVPFYLQPTLGGSDINGAPALSSYSDYRFRAPSILLFRESLEHSIYGPLGFTLSADQGTLGLGDSAPSLDHFRHSYSTGLTVRAGGFPQIFLVFAWGGGEGTHTTANINTSLLGGSRRPSLF